jgi:hypothetical protein
MNIQWLAKAQVSSDTHDVAVYKWKFIWNHVLSWRKFVVCFLASESERLANIYHRMKAIYGGMFI